MANNSLGSTETVTSQATTGNSSEAGGINFEEIAQGFVCPISQELMVEPVLVEDSHVFEYDMIYHHFKTCEDSGTTITSLMTRQNMGTKLVPIHGFGNIIDGLCVTNVLTGRLVDQYRKAKEEKERRQKDLINRARDGEV